MNATRRLPCHLLSKGDETSFIQFSSCKRHKFEYYFSFIVRKTKGFENGLFNTLIDTRS